MNALPTPIRRVAMIAATTVSIASQPLCALAENGSGVITGTIHTVAGAPAAGAHVILSGPSREETTSDGNGRFTFSGAPAGIYRLQVNKGGYLPASAADITVVRGTTITENVVLQQTDLSSLHSIGTVATSAHSSINTGAASETTVTQQQLQSLANPQMNEALQQVPGLNLSRTGSAPNTTISLGGAQPYETQVLLDGHPLSTGRYGSWISQYFNAFMIGGIETEIGPGNTTPFAGTAIGGTANILTPSYNGRSYTSFTTGMDSYGSQYSDFLSVGKLGEKLSYVFGAGYNGSNGPYQGQNGCVVSPASAAKDNLPGSTGIIQYCGSLGAPLFQKGEIAKLHYDFSSATSLEFGYIGSQSGYYPQGTGYGQYAGNMTIVNCLSNGHCTNPNDSGYIGKTINGYIFYPGSNVFNDQPLFEGQLRTAIGQNTLLVRPYAGTVLRDIDGGGESAYPNYYTSAGVEVPQSPYTTLELDKLHGTTVSFIHPFGDNEVTATYDYHSDDTYAQAGTPSLGSLPVVVPDTMARTNIFSLTGNFALARNLTLATGAYETNWQLTGWQAYQATPTSKPQNVPNARSVSHFDPHVAFTFSPHVGLSYRASYGTSVNFPYAGNISGIPYIAQPSATAPNGTTLVEKNPNLQPEVAHEFDLGLDKRLHDGSVLSLDLLDMNIQNVMETATTQVNLPSYTYVNMPINAALLSSQSAMIKYSRLPALGFGYYLTGTVQRSVVTGIPLSVYTAAYSQPANGVQICGTICIPYLKAYGSIQYAFRDKTLLMLGADFEGKNNSYNQAPLTLVNFTYRHPVSRLIDAQISVDNLLNTNAYDNLVVPNLGVTQVGENNLGRYGPYTTPIIPALPRTVRMQFTAHV
jgi:Carboxypeptidase regulatory-like domain/TonB dependent receptor/TonB-dependent Receptor Plug Domain